MADCAVFDGDDGECGEGGRAAVGRAGALLVGGCWVGVWRGDWGVVSGVTCWVREVLRLRLMSIPGRPDIVSVDLVLCIPLGLI